MSAEESPRASSEALPAGARFLILKVFVKDISYESPNAPEIFRSDWKPDVDLQMHNSARKVAGDTYEIAVRMTATATVGEQTAFLVEVVQAGIFQISGFDDEELREALGSTCPAILFPFVRETVSDLVTRGGFPQLLLAPVNFDVLYQRQLAQDAVATSGAPAP